MGAGAVTKGSSRMDVADGTADAVGEGVAVGKGGVGEGGASVEEAAVVGEGSGVGEGNGVMPGLAAVLSGTGVGRDGNPGAAAVGVIAVGGTVGAGIGDGAAAQAATSAARTRRAMAFMMGGIFSQARPPQQVASGDGRRFVPIGHVVELAQDKFGHIGPADLTGHDAPV